ncbi:MAG: hypothetical protein COZ91_02160 [Candidatus Nealsonbacteria bacterium CG_4_8_14_3_um_filter_39_7]|uniref:Uncharacterized protein n=1 Tax=Candidatus Nealsonbacteria bacterium CG23_combo_of_CG06-09_8_20_14_all_39_17 TaxID=1974722 RepID=A0A2G9YTM6_9BACT|nr:MAG: hypothetical protein COX37_03110 [Candidatus Nealsonbacteria bacterium CG23_combo_of_CG06-09_8_20_14_all_39_17]PIW91117.1 MAG: hypothetical protein COZ91_02160 [Candidatus Nealsonbacteria bacterium CG_4_8_14_3_um_filter_39_7]
MESFPLELISEIKYIENNMTNLKKHLFIISTLTFLVFPAFSFAASCPTNAGGGDPAPGNLCLNLDYPIVGSLDLNNDQKLNQLAVWFYYFIVFTSGIAAFVSFVWAGFDWLTSAGNDSKIRSAKDRIRDALLGLAIIMASYIIIQVINPELVVFKLPTLPHP